MSEPVDKLESLVRLASREGLAMLMSIVLLGVVMWAIIYGFPGKIDELKVELEKGYEKAVGLSEKIMDHWIEIKSSVDSIERRLDRIEVQLKVDRERSLRERGPCDAVAEQEL